MLANVKRVTSKAFRSVGMAALMLIPILVIVGGIGLGVGSYWLAFKAKASDFSSTPKAHYTEPAVAKWPLCWRCEYQPPR